MFVSVLRASVVYVEVPKEATLEDLYPPKPQIERMIYKTLGSLGYSEGDAIILFTKDGKVLTPEDFGLPIDEFDNMSSPRDIVPVRGPGWTDEEWAQVMFVWNLAYPRLKNIYGWPYCKCGGWGCLGSHKVVIQKNPSLSSSGLFTPSVSCWFDSKIEIRSWEPQFGKIWGPVLIHEMAHAFRNYKAIPFDQFEEGNAEAMEVEITNRICRETGNLCDYRELWHGWWNNAVIPGFEYMLFQQWNMDFIGTKRSFWSLVDHRYRVSGYSWWKLWFYLSSYYGLEFFRAFNDEIYRRRPLLSYNTYYNIAKNIVGGRLLEDNLNFDEWWDKQYALKTSYFAHPSDICQAFALGLIAQPTGENNLEITVFAYWRWTDGGNYQERTIPGRYVRVRVWDINGIKFKDTLINTSSMITHFVGLHNLPEGIYKVESYMVDEYNQSTCNHLKQERVAPVFDFPVKNWPDNLAFVSLTNTDYEPDRGRVFYYWPVQRARWSVYDVNYPDRWSLFAKDKGPYIIYPGGWEKVPPVRPRNIRVVKVDTVYRLVKVAWSPNEDADLRNYRPCWFVVDDPSRGGCSNVGMDTTYSLGLINKGEIYGFYVLAYDYDGNASVPSDTVYGGWASDITFGFNGNRDLSIGDKMERRIKVYNVEGRLVYEGEEKGFKGDKGVYFIVYDGKVKKEVVR
ncbi:MAG: hypothetical protein ABIL12_03620 [candidate division WOR-3 bacterium]